MRLVIVKASSDIRERYGGRGVRPKGVMQLSAELEGD
jgi:hypothetical protein